MKAPNSGIRLTSADAAIIKGMIARGDRQHDIAAYFGVNGGRIGEISKGRTFANVPLQSQNLPPPGPYLTPVSMNAMKKKMIAARAALAKPDVPDALRLIEEALADLSKK